MLIWSILLKLTGGFKYLGFKYQNPCLDLLIIKESLLIFAGGKNLVSRVKSSWNKSESVQVVTELMESKNELNRKLYEEIEPYATGMLKVSDVHTIYWEQSGNPSGHVSDHTYVFFYL